MGVTDFCDTRGRCFEYIEDTSTIGTTQVHDLNLLSLDELNMETSVWVGSGNFGQASRVRMKNTSQIFVIKNISKNSAEKTASGLREIHFGTLFAAEASSTLEECPSSFATVCKRPTMQNLRRYQTSTGSLGRYVDVTEDNRSMYLLFHDEGTSLDKHQPHVARLPIADLKNICKQLVVALFSLHERGVYHRDLKPANIVMNELQVIKIIDFGSAIDERSVATMYEDGGPHRSGETDSHYSGPEMFYRQELFFLEEGEAFDVWSLGVTILELLSGKHHPVSSRQDQVASIGKALGAVVLQVLAAREGQSVPLPAKEARPFHSLLAGDCEPSRQAAEMQESTQTQ